MQTPLSPTKPLESDPLREYEDRIKLLSVRFAKSPLNRDFNDYFEHIRALNLALHGVTCRFIDQIVQVDSALSKMMSFRAEGRCAFVTTGSDGRCEKGTMSPVEVIVAAHDPFFARCLQRVLSATAGNTRHAEIISKDVYWWSPQQISFGTPELRGLTEFRVRPMDPRSRPLVSPTRVFDAMAIYGDDKVVSNIRRALYRELLEPEVGAHVHRHLKERIKDFRKICREGVNAVHGIRRQHYTVSDAGGALYFDNAYCFGTKLGPMRLIQFRLADDYVQSLRGAHDKELAIQKLDSLLSQHPSVPERLEAVATLDPSVAPKARELASLYKYFLWLYHCSQNVFYTEQRKEISFAELGLTADSFNRKINRVIELTRDPVLLP